MKSVSEFYNNLPQKSCSRCGKIMSEQAESYKTNCDECEAENNYPA